MAFFASNKNTSTGTEMSFLQHLEELRWHLVRSSIVIVVFGIAAFCLNDFLLTQLSLVLYDRILSPIKRCVRWVTELAQAT